MADAATVAELQKASDSVDAVDLAKLLRKNLGEESLEIAFEQRLKRIRQIRDFALKYASNVHADYVNQVRSNLSQIAAAMKTQSERNHSDFINQKAQFLTQIDGLLEESRRQEHYFVSAAVIERGFLEDEGIRREYQRTIDDMKRETAATLDTVKQEADRAIQDAKKLADEIEAKARRTATKISVQEAQTQFGKASTDLDGRVTIWAVVLGTSLAVLVAVPIAFLWWPLPQSDQWAVHLYHSLLRFVVLSALAGFATFSAKMLRAHLHMAEKNRHRVRVANSVESFVNSALDPQQRDLILAKLVEAIVDFGESGLIKHDGDDMASPATSGDILGRILAAVTAKR